MRQHDSNHFEKVEVSATAFIICSRWNFNATSLFIFIETDDADDIIEYSFSGQENEIHGELNPAFLKGICFDNRTCSRIYFRRKEEGQAVVVRIEAWRP